MARCLSGKKTKCKNIKYKWKQTLYSIGMNVGVVVRQQVSTNNAMLLQQYKFNYMMISQILSHYIFITYKPNELTTGLKNNYVNFQSEAVEYRLSMTSFNFVSLGSKTFLHQPTETNVHICILQADPF